MSAAPRTAEAPAGSVNRVRLGLGIVVAVVANLVVFAVASAAGASWSANGQSVNAVLVVIATVVPMVIGGVITVLLARRWTRAIMTMAWVGLAFAVISAPAPLFASDDAATKWALAAMHVVTGVVWFVAIRPRRSSAGA